MDKFATVSLSNLTFSTIFQKKNTTTMSLQIQVIWIVKLFGFVNTK